MEGKLYITGLSQSIAFLIHFLQKRQKMNQKSNVLVLFDVFWGWRSGPPKFHFLKKYQGLLVFWWFLWVKNKINILLGPDKSQKNVYLFRSEDIIISRRRSSARNSLGVRLRQSPFIQPFRLETHQKRVKKPKATILWRFFGVRGAVFFIAKIRFSLENNGSPENF